MRGNLPLAPRRFPPPPPMGRKSAHEPLRVGPRAQPRHRGGNRPRRTLGARALHRRRRDRNRPHRLAHERWVAAAGRNPPRTGYLTRRVIPADWKPDFFAVKRTRPRLVGRSVKRATPHMLVVRV